MSPRRRVAVVTGGAGGIGASIAEALGREGWYVVTVDPLVTLDGTGQLPEPADSTAARITAAGGSARASSASVTDSVTFSTPPRLSTSLTARPSSLRLRLVCSVAL